MSMVSPTGSGVRATASAEHVDTNITAEVWSAVIGYSPRRNQTIDASPPDINK
jgi:hypothetical protein